MTAPPLAAIVGVAGATLDAAEHRLLAQRPPLGVILFRRNIVSPSQLAGLVGELRAVLPAEALLMVDQEGGRVARLRPPHWHAHPTAASLGALYGRDPAAGRRAAFLTGALIGLDCAAAGFDVVCAPVLDRAVAGAHAVIGDRAFGPDGETIVTLASAFADGLLSAGVQPVGKHVPGHGRAGSDSHVALPELDGVDALDLAPFAALAWLPWLMTAHIRYHDQDPMQPATFSRKILEGVVRDRLGFDNLLVSDDLAMGALGDVSPGDRAMRALQAGCDVALHCSGVLAETRAVLERMAPLHDAALARLERARALAAVRRTAAEAAALAAERKRLTC
ncbi:beta-N-acetylhexosaminidase [Lichenicoccus sp.]|uniref:beta-N-acetylhexosaminidase n=1 Tax=Lichenicoccus sp. TaxID=2781899 RepID=UPI003D125FB8